MSESQNRSNRMSQKKSIWTKQLHQAYEDTGFIVDTRRAGKPWSMGDLMQIAYKLEKLGHRGEVIHEEFVRNGRESRGLRDIRVKLARLQKTSEDYVSFMRWEIGLSHRLIPRYVPVLMLEAVLLPGELVQLDRIRAERVM